MRTPAKLTLLLSLLALLILPGCNKLRARDELNKGVRAYKGGQFEEAIDHFRRAVEADPNLLNARIYLATAYASQYVPGSPSEENKKIGQAAIQGFEDVLQKDPNNPTALGYIASLYFGMGGAEKADAESRRLFEKSKEYRRRLIEVEPRNAEHYYSIGVIDWTLTYRHRMQLKADLHLQPDQPLPPRDRKKLAEDNGALVEEGIQVLQKALDINPKYLDAIAYLNLMYREKADLVESPREREQLLQQADELVDRHKRLREEQQQAPPPAPAS